MTGQVETTTIRLPNGEDVEVALGANPTKEQIQLAAHNIMSKRGLISEKPIHSDFQPSGGVTSPSPPTKNETYYGMQTEYRYGGKSEKGGIDCSGYGCAIAKRLGHDIPNSTSGVLADKRTQPYTGKLPDRAVIVRQSSQSPSGRHEGILIDGKIYDAAGKGKPVGAAHDPQEWLSQGKVLGVLPLSKNAATGRTEPKNPKLEQVEGEIQAQKAKIAELKKTQGSFTLKMMLGDQSKEIGQRQLRLGELERVRANLAPTGGALSKERLKSIPDSVPITKPYTKPGTFAWQQQQQEPTQYQELEETGGAGTFAHAVGATPGEAERIRRSADIKAEQERAWNESTDPGTKALAFLAEGIPQQFMATFSGDSKEALVAYLLNVGGGKVLEAGIRAVPAAYRFVASRLKAKGVPDEQIATTIAGLDSELKRQTIIPKEEQVRMPGTVKGEGRVSGTVQKPNGLESADHVVTKLADYDYRLPDGTAVRSPEKFIAEAIKRGEKVAIVESKAAESLPPIKANAGEQEFTPRVGDTFTMRPTSNNVYDSTITKITNNTVFYETASGYKGKTSVSHFRKGIGDRVGKNDYGLIGYKKGEGWGTVKKGVESGEVPSGKAVVYHGTNSQFDTFDSKATVDGGIHFGTKEQATMRTKAEGRRLIGAELATENLRRSRDMGGNWKSKIASAKAAGHDGIVYLNRYEGISTETVLRAQREGVNLDKLTDAQFRKFAPEAQDSYIVFDPKQIKQIQPEAKVSTAAEPASKAGASTKSPPHITKPPQKGVQVKETPSDAFGLATRFEKEGRPATREKHGVRVDELANAGKKSVESGEVNPTTVYEKARDGKAIEPNEIAAVAYRGKWIENRVDVLTKQLPEAGDVERLVISKELSDLDSEMDAVMEVGSQAQKTFHQTGQALQVAFEKNYSRAQLSARATRDNLGAPLADRERGAFEKLIGEHEGSIAALTAERDTLAKQLATMKPKTTKGMEPKERLITNIQRALHMEPGQLGGRLKREAGAIKIPEGQYKTVNRYVTQLTKHYLNEGATSLDDVVSRMTKDLPFLTEDDALAFLSGRYRERLLTSDVHKLMIDNALRTVRRGAEFRQKSVLGKSVVHLEDAVIATQRAAQAGSDFSFAGLQGLPGAIVSPSNWVKSWPRALTALAKGEKGYLETVAELHRDPAYAYARKNGLKLTDAEGTFVSQEEIYKGNLIRLLRKSNVPLAKQAAELMSRSEEAYSAFLNHQRIEMFKKFVGGQWDNPGALKDAAALTNIMTGRGDGKVADFLSHKAFAYAFYAPRYAYSTFQNAALPLLLPFKFTSAQGRIAATSAWAKQTAAILGGLYVAKNLFGMEVETEWRSPNAGNITLPNGKQINLFHKITDPARFMSQLIGGSFTSKGDFQKAGFYNTAQAIGKYAQSKASPVARVAWNQINQSRFDYDTGKGVPFNIFRGEDARRTMKESFIPLAWQQGMEQGDVSGWLLSLLGVNTNPKEKRKPPTSPQPWRNPVR